MTTAEEAGVHIMYFKFIHLLQHALFLISTPIAPRTHNYLRKTSSLISTFSLAWLVSLTSDQSQLDRKICQTYILALLHQRLIQGLELDFNLARLTQPVVPT